MKTEKQVQQLLFAQRVDLLANQANAAISKRSRRSADLHGVLTELRVAIDRLHELTRPPMDVRIERDLARGFTDLATVDDLDDVPTGEYVATQDAQVTMRNYTGSIQQMVRVSRGDTLSVRHSVTMTQ